MSVTFANNTNYKYLILSEVAQNQSLFEEFSESMVPSYRKLNENGDFGEYIGYVALKGNKLETFLREKGQWDAMHQRCKDFIGSEHIESILLSEDPTFKSLRWKNVTQANAKRFEKAAYLTVKPLTRALLKLKDKPENKLNSTLQKALVASVGYSELSSGAWCSIAKGLNKVLVRPVGGKVNSVVKDGGVVELSSKMSAPVEKVARKYSLPLAEPLKEILGNIKTGVKAAAMCAFLAFTTGVDFVDNPSVIDHVDRAAQKAWDLSGSIETGASDLSVLESSYADVANDEVRQGYAPDILDGTTEIAPSVAGSNYEVEQYEPSFEEKLQEEEQRVVKTSYTAKQGDSMWSISEDIAANLISDFEILVDAEGEPSEMTILVNNIHKSIIDANDLKNPDVIQVGQQVQVGSAVVAILDGSLEERLDFVAELLRPNQDRVLSMSSPRV